MRHRRDRETRQVARQLYSTINAVVHTPPQWCPAESTRCWTTAVFKALQADRFVTGQSYFPFVVFTVAVRTLPSRPLCTAVTRPSSQWFRGTILSHSRTNSHLWIDSCSTSHFERCSTIEIYSLSQRLQNLSAIYWQCLHRFVDLCCLRYFPGCSIHPVRITSKWFGVIGSSSFG